MIDETKSDIAIEPVIHYPRIAETGKTYLLTIDLNTPANLIHQWSYSEEEYVIHILLETEPSFENEPVGESILIVHRFGGTYGSASFYLKACDTERVGTVSIKFINAWGIPIHALTLPGIRIQSSPLPNRSFARKAFLAEQIRVTNIKKEMLDAPRPIQIPPDISFFSGRKSEVTELEKILLGDKSTGPILCLWGMGGIGKSALAIHVANKMYQEGHFKDGILYASINEITIEDTVTNFIRALNYSEDQIPRSSQGKFAFYRSILRNKQLLIILDNVQSEEEVYPFLFDEPGISVIITSRKQMLGLVDHSVYLKDLDLFSKEEAEEFLRKRIGPRCNKEPLVIGRICELAGYLPLALAIVASRLSDEKRWPSLQTFLERVENEDHKLDAFSVYTGRHGGLRSAFYVSYASLFETQQKTFVFLSLFGQMNFGSSGLSALTGATKNEAIDQLEEFVNLSLLLRSDRGGYKFHDLLLLFASENLNQFPKEEVISAKGRLEVYLGNLEKVEKILEEASSNEREGNFDIAIDLYFKAQAINQELQNRSGQANSFLRIGLAYSQKGDFDKAIECCQQAQLLNKEIGNRGGQASALGGLASAFAQKGDLDKAIEYYQQAQLLNKEIGNRGGQASVLGGLASAYAQKGDLDKAIELHSQSIILSKEIGNRSGQASSLGGLASAYAEKGDWGNSFQSYEQAYSLNLEIGDLVAQAKALGGLASSSQQLEKWEEVVQYQEKALIISESLQDLRGQEKAVGGIAFAYSKLNQLEKSIEYQFKALEINKKIKYPKGEAKVYGALASVFQRQGKYEEAIDYYSKAQEINHKTRDVKGQARALGGIASIYYNQKKWALAIPFLEQALELNKKIRDRFIDKTLFQLAVSYMNTGDKQKAKKYAHEASEVTKGKDEKINNLLKTLE